jgi:hypothetical protein
MSAAAKILRGLVSKTDEALNTIKREKGTGAEFLRELEKTPGVKPAEIKDRRLDKVLPAMGKTTKAEVKKVLEQNPPPRVEESVRGGINTSDFDAYREPDNSWNIRRISDRSFVTNVRGFRDDPEGAIAEAARRVGGAEGTKYGEYQIPGGENYREILLKLPSNRPSMKNMSRDEYDAAVEAADRAGVRDFESGHWDETPNVLAHARVSDRTGPNGERILHIEEIQSDWHQAGRKQGYLTPEKKAEIEAQEKAKIKAASDLREIQREYDRAREASQSLDAKIASPEFASFPPEQQARFRESAQSYGNAWLSRLPELMKAREAYESIPAPESASRLVPDAPFKKSWHELTMKRLLNYAAENNYDRVAITPGREQFNRYGSERIDWQKNPEGGWNVHTTEQHGGTHQGQNIEDLARERGILLEKSGLAVKDKDQLKNMIGFALGRQHSAQEINKLTDRIWNRMQTEPEGTSMPRKEGMEGFYDKILPDYLNNFGKQYGSSVEQTDLVTQPSKIEKAGSSYYQTVQKTTPVHTFNITPQMRQEITSKGLPLYSVPAIEGAAATGAGAAIFGEQEKAPVHISDNPDTMRLELEDKQMAGGGIAKALRGAVKAGKKMTPAEEAAIRARGMGVPGVDFADPLAPPTMRMSEALGYAGAEGKVLNFTEADRSRVFGPNRGGVGFSALQLYSEPHKQANTVWGFGNKSVAEKKIRQNDPDNTIWTTYAGSPEQHKSNTVVVKDAIKNLQDANAKGALHPEQVRLINERIRQATSDKGAPLFPNDFDITDPQALSLATTFDRRTAISDALMGTGVKKPMISKEFKAANPGVQWNDASDISRILTRETDPVLANANTFDVGPHFFTMDNKIIHRPDLNEAFPVQVTGTDLGMRYNPAPFRNAAPDFIKQKGYGPTDPINAWALSRGFPRQFIDEKYLTNLQKSGYKKGGVVKLAAGGLSKAAVEALTKMRSLSKEFAEKSAEHARYIQETKNVPTKQLPSFEEWKALQMNATPENIEQLRKETGNKRGGSIKKKR